MSELQQQRICPQCGNSIHRVHRRLLDRVVSLFAPMHRYLCHHCGWTGLRPSSQPRPSRLPSIKNTVRFALITLVLLLAAALGAWVALHIG